MTMQNKSKLSEIMKLAWQFIKRNGYSLRDALRCAWANIRLKAKMLNGIVRFYFTKVDGTVREAFGTLNNRIMPTAEGENKRKHNDTIQVYYDTERMEYRSFKKANLKF
ncbi:SH3 beta-barrel fold-containing protein [Olivibacter sp. CPCC 100613]|uniref:SH3 beta-barrel fold-containing protein n=1 Tax=Olivibacter sp. CPCC 100613 TaxID=3079931 RepID=UPI002FFC56D8